MSITAHHNLRAGAVVRQEQDECIFKDVHAPQLRDHATDFLVHSVHHGGVDGHLGCLKLSLFRI